MSEKAGTFRNVLDKYKFSCDIPGEAKQFIYQNKKHSLVLSLKKLNLYSFTYDIPLSLYFVLRNWGINISLLFVKTALFISTVLLSGSTAIVVYHVISGSNKTSLILPDEMGFPWRNKLKAPILSSTSNKENINAQTRPLFIMGEMQVYGGSDDMSRIILKKLNEGLSREFKGIYILKSDRRYTKQPANKIFGRLHKLGENYIITVKVMDTDSGIIKLSNTRSIKKADTIDIEISVIINSITKSVGLK